MDSIPEIGSERLNGFAAGLKQTNLYRWLGGCLMNYASVVFVPFQRLDRTRDKADTNGTKLDMVTRYGVTMQLHILYCLISMVFLELGQTETFQMLECIF